MYGILLCAGGLFAAGTYFNLADILRLPTLAATRVRKKLFYFSGRMLYIKTINILY